MDLSMKLNEKNVEERNFLSFCLPSNAQLEDKGEFSVWCERMIFLVEDLKWLLSLPVDLFWNQILYDGSWMNCLDTFLQNAPRYYDLKNIPENCRTALSRVSRLFLLAMKRMSSHNENEDLRFSRDVFGDIIYNAFLFDAPKLLDMCSIFYRPNEQITSLLKEILENIFTNQSKYYDDFSEAMDSMVVTLNTMEEKLTSSKGKKCASGKEAADQLMFLFDLSSTLKIFLHVFPKCSKVLFKTSILGRLASICEGGLTSILKLIEINQKMYKYVSTHIQRNVLQIVCETIKHGYIQFIKTGNVDCEDLTIEYMSIIDGLSQQKNFFAKYCSLGSIASDLQVMRSLKSIDVSNLDYISNMAGVAVVENNLDETLKQLRELLPNKKEDYIRNCIQKYGQNVEVIMNNIIEGNYLDESEIPKPVKKKKTIPNKDILEDNKEHVALIRASMQFDDEGNDYDDDVSKYSIYDDEYDDTYDSVDVAAVDADSADELRDLNKRRKFVTPIVLRRRGHASSSSEGEDDNDDDDEDDEENENGEKKEEDNQKTQQQQQRPNNYQRSQRGGNNNNRGKQRGDANKRGNRGGGRGRGAGVERPHDGNDKGGRSKNTSTSNSDNRGRGRGRGRGSGNKHNRRNLADKKMSKGMF